MDTAQWDQGIRVVKKQMEEASSSITTRPAPPQSQQLVERRGRPVKEQALHCPRCNSTNTKFCYYNNYSLTQPRYLCKTCRRYWTDGGSLRNVPVGGGSRKNKRHSSSSPSSTLATTTSSSKINNNLQPPLPPMTSSLQISQISTTTKPYQGQDLNLAFQNNNFPELLMGGFPSNINGGELSAMELLRSTGFTARGLGPLLHMSTAPETGAVYGAGFGLHDFSSAVGIKFPLDGIDNGNGDANSNVIQEGGGRRLLFPYGDLKQASAVKSSNQNDQQNREQGDPPIFWSAANLGGSGVGSW